MTLTNVDRAPGTVTLETPRRTDAVWTDRVVAAYLLAVAILVVVERSNVDQWPLIVVVHCVIGFGVLSLRRLPPSPNPCASGGPAPTPGWGRSR